MEPPRSVEELCARQGLDHRQLAARAGLEEGRVRAILEGRWTPSPQERDRIAAVFGLDRTQIAWGHRTSVEHLYGHGPQFGRTP
jgi:transcriptional regulator with XRE-family HTH domain